MTVALWFRRKRRNVQQDRDAQDWRPSCHEERRRWNRRKNRLAPAPSRVRAGRIRQGEQSLHDQSGRPVRVAGQGLRKETKMARAKHNRFLYGSGAFNCDACGKLTRDTGHNEADHRFCKNCLFNMYVENAESDYGKDSDEYKRMVEEYGPKGTMR